ncbi:MAG: M23 family metallopeptidase [Gammaproteobacteria bacterium]|nr:M23 family metallopeptidase [Gammaproteobacteria bacterium]
MQIIIFKSGKNKSSSYKISGLLFLFLVTSLVIALTLAFSSATYMYGYKQGFYELNEDRIQDISYYQNEIKLIKDENKEKMEFFSQKLISISYQIQNINSLGNKMSNIAKLDKKEFDFKRENNIGGANKVNIEFEYESEFDKYLDNMISNLSLKTDDLNYINKIVSNMEMKEQFFPSGSPTPKGYVSSEYGNRINPFTKEINFHKGIDIAHKTESDIRSLAGGEITYSGKKYGYGNLVEVSHLNGYVTRYAHNNRNLVKVGELVKKGQIIAKMGSTGHSTGPHVHLEVLKNNRHINPNKFIHYKEKFSKNN